MTHEDVTPRNWMLWFGLLSGPIFYSIYFVIGYLLVEAVCAADAMTQTILGLEAISFWVIVLTLVAAAITGYSTWYAYGIWRQTRSGVESPSPYVGYPSFMAFLGAWLSGLFTILILLTGLPAFFLVLCDWI